MPQGKPPGGHAVQVRGRDVVGPEYTDIPVTLTDDWQAYDFDLGSFQSADPSRLHVVAGFLFHQQPEPVRFSVRDVTYLKPGEP